MNHFNIVQPGIRFQAIQPGHYNALYKMPGWNGLFGDEFLVDALGRYNIPAGATIDDIGAGDGRNTLKLASVGYRVNAIDDSQKGIDLIEEAFKTDPLLQRFQPNVQGVAADFFIEECFHFVRS
jgi:2-polyprenyl-3-methyl-5-hydroxy-6-metoxy-1,4-benzoquinol methylase